MPLTAMVRERELLDRALVVSVVGCGALGVASGVTLFGDGAVLRSSSFFDDGLSWAPIWLWALWTVVCGAAMILGGLIHGCALSIAGHRWSPGLRVLGTALADRAPDVGRP